jgi:hypothetical protein
MPKREDDEKDDAAHGPRTLTDEQIVSEARRRRTFLGTALLGTAAIAAAGFVQACKKSDKCDSDVTSYRDDDPSDLVRINADRCDSDDL